VQWYEVDVDVFGRLFDETVKRAREVELVRRRYILHRERDTVAPMHLQCGVEALDC